MTTNKKPFLLVISIILQIIFMYQLFQRTHQLLIISLSVGVYLIFSLGCYYKYAEEIVALTILTKNVTDEIKKLKQIQMRKLLLKSFLYLILIDVLITILFKIDLNLSSSISTYSGVLGILAALGVYDFKKDR